MASGSCFFSNFNQFGVLDISGALDQDGNRVAALQIPSGFEVEAGRVLSLRSLNVKGYLTNRRGLLSLDSVALDCGNSPEPAILTVTGSTQVINSSVAFCGGIDTRDGGVLSLSNSSVDGQSSSGMLTGSNGAIVQSRANQFVNDTPGYVFNFENSQAISSRDLFSGAGQGIYLSGSKFTLDEAVIGGASFDDRATFLVHFASEMQIWGGNVSNLYIDVWANSGLRLDLPSGTAVDAVGISSTDSWIAMSGDFGGGQGSLDARWGSSVLMANWGADTASFEDNFTVTLGYSALLNVADGVAGYILNCNDSLEPRQVSHGTVCLEPGSSVGSSVVP